ncbi:MAG: hypothetical protein AMJ43_03510 [Coxiella sp. DG_40]|nr:MAG: hypothetical protein AMJ43_03510 [Coxiella sp. DG_40]
MNHTSELMKSLQEHFEWNKARMYCFAGMILAMIVVRTVNLRELCVAFESKSQVDSRYKRIRRFFSGFKVDQTEIACWIFKLFFVRDGKYYLIMDRTNWYWGKKKINVLILGLAYEGVAIPLIWELLNKGGNSTSGEQKKILNRFIEIFGKDCIAGILADREFTSEDLFGFLITEKIPFYIRIKNNTRVRVLRSRPWHAKRIFKDVNVKRSAVYPNHVIVYGVTLRLAASRSESGELLIVATNQNPKNAVVFYLRRWEIECLFQGLKTRGFNFESTHITNPERIEKLIAVMAIAFCWVHKIGEWRAIKKPIIFKKFRNNIRPQYSYFRYGLDYLREIILHISQKYKQFKQCLEQLILPINPVNITLQEALT